MQLRSNTVSQLICPQRQPGHMTATSATAAAAQRREARLPSRAANAGEAQMISHDATPGPRAGVDADDCVPGKGRRPKGRRASEPRRAARHGRGSQPASESAAGRPLGAASTPWPGELPGSSAYPPTRAAAGQQCAGRHHHRGAQRSPYSEVFAVREFGGLWYAQVLSSAGDQLAQIAVAVAVYQRTRSPFLTALAYAMSYLPQVVGGPLLGR